MARLWRSPCEPLTFREKVLGPDHLSAEISLNNLAELYRVQGRYGEAETLFHRSLAIYGRVLGSEHPDTAARLNNLALLYFAMAKVPAAESLLQHLNRTQANWLRRELPLQPRELRRTLIDQPKAHQKQGRIGPAPSGWWRRRRSQPPVTSAPEVGGGEPAGAGAVATEAGGLVSTPWLPLAGTEQEARQLAPLLIGSTVISGPAATAAVVLAQKAPRIPAYRHPWLLFGGSAPGERRRKGRGDRSVQPRPARPAAPQRPSVRRRQPARCQSRR